MTARRADPVRVVVVDGHALFREALTKSLSTETGIVMVGEGRDGREAVTLARDVRPDVVLLDVETAGHQVPTMIRRVLQASPASKIIALTVHDEPHQVGEIIGVGARAYLLKSTTREELVAVIRALADDEHRLMLSISRRAFSHLCSGDRSPLSPREMEVLELAAHAMSNSQIGARLYIAEGTVKRHLTNIYIKLDAVSRMDAVNKAVAAGLIRPDTCTYDDQVSAQRHGRAR